MVLLAAVALTTLVANGASRLRAMAAAFLAVSIAANAIAAAAATVAQLAVLGAAGLAASGILFVAARDRDYGEDPEWRLWVATLIAAIATPAAFVSFRSVDLQAASFTLLGSDRSDVLVQVAAFWLLSSGTAILVTARSAVRTSLGALLMLTGVQLLVRLAPGPQLELTIGIAWIEVVVALVGAFLIVNERAVRE
ncbi:MAG: hypothetical protein KGN00_11415 [Chloroflexota bacterium]|nr:hypothetical protein [Chloroflexota bacterium]MDE3194284.1 hypothetical protein [Chloroflexota bacterium]